MMEKSIKSTINIQGNGSNKKIIIKVSGANNPEWFRYVLLYNDRPVKEDYGIECSRSKNANHSWLIGNRPGLWSCFITVKDDDGWTEEYTDYVRTNHEHKHQKINITEIYKEVHWNDTVNESGYISPLCVISAPILGWKPPEKLIKRNNANGIRFHQCMNHATRTTCLFSGNLDIDNKGRTYALSGVVNSNNSLWFPHGNTIPDTENIKPESPIGFGLVTMDDCNVNVRGDSYGFERFWKYEKSNWIIISNSVSLILSSLNDLRINIELDYDSIIGYLSLPNIFLEQNSWSTGIKDVEKLEPGLNININHKGVYRNPINKLFTTEFSPWNSEREYIESLYAIADDFNANVRLLANSFPDRLFLCDLSGGLDSRFVYSTAVHVPELVGRLRTYSRSSPDNPNEDAFGHSLSSIYNIKIDGIPKERAVPPSYKDAFSTSISLLLDGYYGRNHGRFCQTSHRYEAERLIGGGGEFFRPYWSSAIKENWAIDDLVNHLTIRSPWQSKVFPEAIYNVVKPSLKKLFDNTLPGKNLREKLDSYYLFYRQPIHFSHAVGVFRKGHSWSIMLSELCFRAYRKSVASGFPALKFSFDLQRTIDPLLGNIKYVNDKYNTAFETNKVGKEFDYWSHSLLKNAPLEIIPHRIPETQGPVENVPSFNTVEEYIKQHDRKYETNLARHCLNKNDDILPIGLSASLREILNDESNQLRLAKDRLALRIIWMDQLRNSSNQQ